MKITPEIKKQLEKMYNDKIDYKQIIEKLNISIAQYYRLIKPFKKVFYLFIILL